MLLSQVIEPKIESSIIKLVPKLFEKAPNLEILSLRIDNIDAINGVALIELKDLLKLKLVDSELSIVNNKTFLHINTNINELVLHNDKIKVIEPSAAFKMFQDLHILRITRNFINELQPHVFVGLQKLETLQIRFENKLTLIPKNVFNELPKLKKLEITFNHISEIEENAFDDPSITQLGLSNNYLTKIENGTFNGLVNLEHLLINTNNIKEIKPWVFDNLPYLNRLELIQNDIKKIYTVPKKM